LGDCLYGNSIISAASKKYKDNKIRSRYIKSASKSVQKNRNFALFFCPFSQRNDEEDGETWGFLCKIKPVLMRTNEDSMSDSMAEAMCDS